VIVKGYLQVSISFVGSTNIPLAQLLLIYLLRRTFKTKAANAVLSLRFLQGKKAPATTKRLVSYMKPSLLICFH
jgi:hypothetical protein